MQVQELEIVDGNAPTTAPAVTEVIVPELDAPAQPTIEERENALALKENTIEAKAIFAKASIPESMLEFVVHADKAIQQANLEKFSKAWAIALKTAVKGKVAGEAPTRVENAPYKPFSKMTYAERMALKRSSPDAYNRMAKQ